MSFYPPCPNEGDVTFLLETVVRHLQEDDQYLDDIECPYGPELRLLLQSMAPKVIDPDDMIGRASELEDANPDEDRWVFLDREVQALYQSLKKQADNLTNSTSAEKMSYFRTATSLLEKLVGLQERTVGLKRISEFHNTVMEIMEDVLSPDQRTRVMDQLGKAMTA